MTDVTDLTTSQSEIRRRVAAIGAQQWDLPTPCSNWNVRDLVIHMIEGSRMSLALLHGASAQESRAVFGVDHGPDLPAEMDVAMADELAAFEVPGAFDRIVHHPAAGDVPGMTLYQFRTADYLLHSWDVARATEGDEGWHEGLVVTVWDGLQPMAPFIADIGVFGSGPSGTVDEGAPLQLRLLDLTGRRP